MTEFIALSLQGGREKVDGQRFRELTTDWNAKPNSITLSNKSFDCEAAEALVEYLNTIDGDALTILDMGDVIASRPEDEALAALRIMSSGFKRFKLVNVNVSDNAFGAKGIDACKDVMEHMPLRVRQCGVSFTYYSPHLFQSHLWFRNFMFATMVFLLRLLESLPRCLLQTPIAI